MSAKHEVTIWFEKIPPAQPGIQETMRHDPLMVVMFTPKFLGATEIDMKLDIEDFASNLLDHFWVGYAVYGPNDRVSHATAYFLSKQRPDLLDQFKSRVRSMDYGNGVFLTCLPSPGET